MTVSPERDDMTVYELQGSTCDFCEDKAKWVRKQSCGCWITLCPLHKESFWQNNKCIVCRQIFDATFKVLPL